MGVALALGYPITRRCVPIYNAHLELEELFGQGTLGGCVQAGGWGVTKTTR